MTRVGNNAPRYAWQLIAQRKSFFWTGDMKNREEKINHPEALLKKVTVPIKKIDIILHNCDYGTNFAPVINTAIVYV